MPHTSPPQSTLLRSLLTWAVVLIAIVASVAWLSGSFVRKTAPGHQPLKAAAITGPLAQVTLDSFEELLPTIGTVRAVQAVEVSSQLLAEVQGVQVNAGDTVKAGDPLVQLDNTALKAREAQAIALKTAADAKQQQTASDLERLSGLRENNAATARELSDAVRDHAVAQAQMQAALQGVAEAQSQLNFAHIASPLAGRVVKRHVEPGNVVQPGAPLITLEGQLQLEAQVPESQVARLKVGDAVQVEIDALHIQYTGAIREIVPQASTASRTFTVKVGGPCPPEVQSGMFGRMLVPMGQGQRLTLPAAAVRRVGQLESVFVADASGTHATRRMIRTGTLLGDRIEVISGLHAGERVVLNSSEKSTSPTPSIKPVGPVNPTELKEGVSHD
ncbi:MAG: efflux RND transporter periplasmic adaptor subunit [Algisphaera sp.]